MPDRLFSLLEDVDNRTRAEEVVRREIWHNDNGAIVSLANTLMTYVCSHGHERAYECDLCVYRVIKHTRALNIDESFRVVQEFLNNQPLELRATVSMNEVVVSMFKFVQEGDCTHVVGTIGRCRDCLKEFWARYGMTAPNPAPPEKKEEAVPETILEAPISISWHERLMED